ncbi:hypothetical protein FIBSPDRAFT_964019 [Athelia psychrophila]|uniref:F-box domain-containing protein n=1 Tax=Athelia psychrophila TaxID=1759441 RepID=A0A165Y980_9AGAM|nr:hypothetical protein FIBSPDRAFT_964019 [Fibularhizoctonia sp. CBS 109695]
MVPTVPDLAGPWPKERIGQDQLNNSEQFRLPRAGELATFGAELKKRTWNSGLYRTCNSILRFCRHDWNSYNLGAKVCKIHASLPHHLADIPMDLATTLGMHRSAYIVSLPAEIVALVFEICYRQYSNKVSARKFVLRMSHVSQQWRSAVACQQIFWTDVLITITKCTLLWPMEQCLQRSGTLPVDVDITSTQKMDSEALELVTRTICGAIASHANRWRSFRARCRAGTNMLLVMRGLRDMTAPVLEDLQLVLEEEEMDGGAPWRLRISAYRDISAGDGVPHDILNLVTCTSYVVYAGCHFSKIGVGR